VAVTPPESPCILTAVHNMSRLHCIPSEPTFLLHTQFTDLHFHRARDGLLDAQTLTGTGITCPRLGYKMVINLLVKEYSSA
jgi:hypothetical protein